MLFQCWPTANGAGPTLKQHWVKSSCLLGELSHFDTRVPSVSGWNRLHSALCMLTLAVLNYFCINHDNQRVCSIWNHQKCLS